MTVRAHFIRRIEVIQEGDTIRHLVSFEVADPAIGVYHVGQPIEVSDVLGADRPELKNALGRASHDELWREIKRRLP